MGMAAECHAERMKSLRNARAVPTNGWVDDTNRAVQFNNGPLLMRLTAQTSSRYVLCSLASPNGADLFRWEHSTFRVRLRGTGTLPNLWRSRDGIQLFRGRK